VFARLREIGVLVLAEEVRLQPAAALLHQRVAIGTHAMELWRAQGVHATLWPGSWSHCIRSLGRRGPIETDAGLSCADMELRRNCVGNWGHTNHIQ